MDPEHASIAGRLFFSQVEKNQKTQRRGEKLYGEDGRAAAERQNSLRSDTAAPRRRNFAAASPAFLRASPSGRKRRAEARSQNDLRESVEGFEGRRGLGGANYFAPYAFGVGRKCFLKIIVISAARTREVRNDSHLLWALTDASKGLIGRRGQKPRLPEGNKEGGGSEYRPAAFWGDISIERM